MHLITYFTRVFFAKNLPVLTGKSNSRMMLKYIKAFKNNFFKETRNWLQMNDDP